MLDISTYRRIYGTGGVSSGQAKKSHSDMIMEYTWDRDLQSQVAYLYDYYHDDEDSLNYNLDPSRSKVKVPIQIKFIVNSYNSDGKDQVSYHIQFKPSQECNVDYYKKDYEERYNIEFPIGLYIDIADNKGIYRRWLVVADANTLNPQFSTWAVLPCDTKFHWIYKNKRYSMWGVSRSQNSYNNGVWVDYKIETVENQKKFWVPFNEESATLYYNQRIIVSMPIPEPITWRISKVENTSPRGINKITMAQDRFDQHHDYIEKDEEGRVVAMWADYFQSAIEPENPEVDLPPVYGGEISVNGVNPKMKVGGSFKTFTATLNDADGEKVAPPDIKWRLYLNNEFMDDLSMLDIVMPNSDNALLPNQLSIKFVGDDTYIGSILGVEFTSGQAVVLREIEIVGL